MKLYLDKTNEGIRKDRYEHYRFDDTTDFADDILFLQKPKTGQVTHDNLTYYFAYQYNENSDEFEQTEFRNALKHKLRNKSVFYSGDVDKFIYNGLMNINKLKNINDFDVVISTATDYGEQTLTGAMCFVVWDILKKRVNTYDMRLLKKMCKDVTFDEERARESLSHTKRYGNNKRAMDAAIEAIKAKFEEEQSKPNGIFQMKRYKPVHGRAGFIDFLKFKNPYDQETYERLKAGTEVLILDDFLTTGSTVKEIVRFLNAINPNNKISIFVLIDQYRDM